MNKRTEVVVVTAAAGALDHARDPLKLAMQIHAADKAEEIAVRAKDVTALEAAVKAKMEGQRDFAADYKARFPLAGRNSTVDRSVHGRPETYCRHHGFNDRTVRRWAEKLLEPDSYAAEFHQRFAKLVRLIEMEQAANFSSESFEWYTPGKYIEAVREVLGGIDLDPASSEQANATVRAAAFFSEADNGLEREWRGRVFVNPPYGKSEHGSLAGAFCKKAIAEYESGNVQACIILVNSVHSQQWQAPLYDQTVCFVDHRIQFILADGEENKNPTFQNILVYLGPDERKFAAVFNHFGYVMRKVCHE